jgi:uncharacterized protein (TIGR02270 family)
MPLPVLPPPPYRPGMRPDLMPEHLEMLEFLWSQREQLLYAPDWTLSDLAALEDRFDAHLDGVRLAAEHAMPMALPWLEGDEPGRAMAAAFAVAVTERADLFAHLAKVLEEGPGEAADGVRAALRHVPIEPIVPALASLARAGDLERASRAVDVLVFQRKDVPLEIEPLLSHAAPQVRVRAWQAAGRLRAKWIPGRLSTVAAETDPTVRAAALHAAALAGAADALGIARGLAFGQPPSPEAIAFIGAVGDGTDVPRLIALLSDKTVAPVVLDALGAIGLPACVLPLLERLESKPDAAAASGALLRIAGPGAFRARAAADRDPFADDEDGDAPVVEPVAAKRWWDAQREELPAAMRLQQGVDVSRGARSPDFDALPLQTRRDLWLRTCLSDRPPTRVLELEGRARSQMR